MVEIVGKSYFNNTKINYETKVLFLRELDGYLIQTKLLIFFVGCFIFKNLYKQNKSFL